MAEENWVFVVGAGASRELGQNGPMPLMGDWRRELCRDLDSAYPGAAEILGLNGPLSSEDAGLDFERRLGTFLRWRAALPAASAFPLFGFASGSSTTPQEHGANDQWFRQAQTNGSLLLRAVHASLYRLFGGSCINHVAAAKAYGSLLRQLGVAPEDTVSFATTNYDSAIELAMKDLDRRPYWGEDASHGGSNYLYFEDITDRGSQHTAVLHLHGKVGWYWQDGRILALPPESGFDQERIPALLLPDLDKAYDGDDLTRSMWQQFERLLDAGPKVLVLGHSLRDKALVDALSHAKADRIGVVVCDAHDQTRAIQDRAAERNRYRLFEEFQEILPGSHFLPGMFSESPTFDDHALGAWAGGSGRIVPPKA